MPTPFLSEIKIMAFNFAPKGWALCNGQLLPINQNQPLFAVLGTTYGGCGRVNFALPALRSRTPISMGSSYTLGERGGAENVTITSSTMPAHTHFLMVDNSTATPTQNVPASNNILSKNQGVASTGGTFAFTLYSANPPNALAAPQIVGMYGGSQPHTNIAPYLCINFSIALQGIFPSQN